MEEDFFVQIREATDVRKAILHTSKQIIDVLKRYEKLKKLRIEKVEQIMKLRLLNKEIKLLSTKLKKEFPETKIRVRQGKEKRVRIKTSINSADNDEFAELENQLHAVEAKLNRLG